MLKLWNTASHELEKFKSIKPGEVGMYTCGPTVYNPATIGNLRSYVFEDVLQRTLELLGYRVKRVMNITDVGHLTDDRDGGEDKMEREAAKTKRSAWEIAQEYEDRFLEDLDRLQIRRPFIMPRATEHIPEQIELIQILEAKGFTYVTSDGVYFDTAQFDTYGQLSGQRLAEKEEGARVTVNPEKRNPSDFALWKLSVPKGTHPELVEGSRQKRQMEWESPWGVGFPGWHLECSAMSVKYLGQPFDIHCGGVDHIAVHHENEIAQSEAAFDKRLANYWLHHDFLLVDSRRMGKSEGNAYTLDDLIAKEFDPLAFRYYCLGTHYRSKMNFTWEGLEAAQEALSKLKEKAARLSTGEVDDDVMDRFEEALGEDLNVSVALSVMWDLLKSDAAPSVKGGTLMQMDQVLGLNLVTGVDEKTRIPEEIQELAEVREQARASKDWQKADALREQLEEEGWNVEDQKDGFRLTKRA